MRVLVRGWVRAEAEAGARPQSWAGARERVVSALDAYGVEVDAEVERIAALHWDGHWGSILRDAIIATRNSRDPMWPPGHAAWDAHERRVKTAIDALAAFDASLRVQRS